MCFGPFTLNTDTRQLTRGGEELHLPPKAFELLAMLVAERPKVVPKSTLQERLWPGTFVAEANLANLVAEIREALGDRPRTPVFIRTSHGFGYAFCGTVIESGGEKIAESDGEQTAPLESLCWLEWGDRRVPLSPGEYVMGRDHDVDVRIDAATVSRRHARLVITGDAALLEDCGSKNGTFVEGRRVTASVPVADGDAIHLGSLRVLFRQRERMMSTITNIGLGR
jgi:DNA-binding winged helix-turn-helix (wHTH) protein